MQIKALIVLLICFALCQPLIGEESMKSNADSEQEEQEITFDDPDIDLQGDNFKKFGTFSLFDKLNHSVRTINADVGVIVEYRKLEIMLISCWSSNRNDEDYKALVKISDHDKVVFHGWLFSQSPSISTMEHQKYYVQLLKCSNDQW